MDKNFNPINRIRPMDEILILVFMFVIYFIYKYYPISQYSLAREDREPMLVSFWSEVVKSDTVVISIDLFNIDKPTTSIVKYWERTELISDFNDTNTNRILKFDRPQNNVISRFSVNCDTQTYQLINTIYTSQEVIVPQKTNKAPLAAKSLEKGTPLYYSAQYACKNKDINIDEMIDSLPAEKLLNAIL